MQYHDFELEAVGSLIADGPSRKGKYQVRVLRSPMGEMNAAQAVSVEYDDRALQSLLNRLEERVLDADGLIKLGSALAAILLPISTLKGGLSVRELFAQSLVKISSDDGLRLRLRLPYELSVIPWEYMFVERAGGEGMDGFLALDPRTAIVRHEELTAPADLRVLSGDIKIVTAIAEGPGLPELDLPSEERILQEGLKGLDVVVEPCRQATLTKLTPLLNGAGVFHFAGHGDFQKQMGPRVGTYKGKGFLAFEDGPVDAEQVAITLRSNGIRLAVLAACDTARRDGYNVWSGIAPTLVKALIPAVVANQYKIKDTTAIAFSQQFYQALAAGLPIERAMTVGRIGVYNQDKTGRDWGVPVLYMRAGDGVLFEGPTNDAKRERAQERAEGKIRLRVKEVKAGAVVVGADLARMLKGRLAVSVTVPGTVLGEVVVAAIDNLEGGSVDVDADVDTVGPGGTFVGYKGNIGTPRRRGQKAANRMKSPQQPELADERRAWTTVNIGDNKGQAIGTQINYNYVQEPPPAQDALTFSIGKGWTFRNAADALAEIDRATVKFDGFSDDELNSTLLERQIRVASVADGLRALGSNVDGKPFPEYLVSFSRPTYRLAVTRS